MVIRRLLSLSLAAFLLLAPAAWAAPAPKDTPEAAKEGSRRVPIEVLKFQFEDETGKTADFQVKVGGAIQITNAKSGLFYRMTAIKDKEGKAEVRLLQYTDATRETLLAEEAITTQVGADFQASGISPFRVKMVGSEIQLAKLVPATQVPEWIACCIFCGDWYICCEVEVYEPGWAACCGIGMCGMGCVICEVMYEQ